MNVRNMELIMLDRNYIAISLKHSTKDCIMYWGTRTQDNESRCFSGYTANFSNCELYSPDEFYSNYGKKNYPIVDKCSSYSKLRKDYKDRDTVLVKASDWDKVLKEADKKARYNRAKKGANILSKGDKVVMHTCAEARHYDGKIWECASDSWDNYGTELVMLKDFSGGFCTEFL